MSNMTRWTPTEVFRHPFFASFPRVFDDMFDETRLSGRSEDVAPRAWMPAVDVKETDDAVTVYVELPGVTKDDIDVSLHENVLTVSGERHFERDEKKENFHRVERAYGKFSRSFRLPANVNGTKVDAKFKDGVLTLELPKVEEAKPRQIKIA